MERGQTPCNSPNIPMFSVFCFTGNFRGATTGPVPGGTTLTSKEVSKAIGALAAAIAKRHGSTGRLVLAGIARGGIPLANLLAEELKNNHSVAVTVGTVDVSFHRDDIGHNPIPRELPPSHFNEDVAGATLILVDDVLFSGRTVKAALDEIFDHGRPAKVELAVLVDRGGRLLPFQADYVGISMDVSGNRRVTVTLDESNRKRHSVEVAAS